MSGGAVALDASNRLWFATNPLPTNLPGFAANPQANNHGMLTRATLAPPVGTLSITQTLQSLTGLSLETHAFLLWDFVVAGLASDYGYFFKTSASIENIVIDILDDSLFGQVIAHPTYPRKIATTSLPTMVWDEAGPPMIPPSHNRPGGVVHESAIWGWNPADYGLGDGNYRLRLRGENTLWPYFQEQISASSPSFTLEFQIAPKWLGCTIHHVPQEPGCMEAIRFEAEIWEPALVVPGAVFTWDFGDGSPTVTGETAIHRYTVPGAYMVHLQVTQTIGDTFTFDTYEYVQVFQREIGTMRVLHIAANAATFPIIGASLAASSVSDALLEAQQTLIGSSSAISSVPGTVLDAI